MNELADKHQIDIKEDPQLWKLRSLTGLNKPAGNVNTEWTYQFHGGGCDFVNTRTQQFLYVHTFSGLYGKIDFYYLYKYMLTTAALTHAANAFPAFENFRDILFELEHEKILVDLGDYPEESPYKDLFLVYLLE